MNCPNCGAMNHKKDSFCRKCSTPLSNAQFAPAPPKAGKRGKTILIFFLVLFLLCAGAGIGFYSYLKVVELKCRENVEKVMECAQKMDFSEFDKDLLPKDLAEQPNVKLLISDTIDQMIEENRLSGIISSLGIKVDYDSILDQILKNADYTIDEVSASYNSCRVSLTTSNINYSSLAQDMEEDLSALIHEYTMSPGWLTGIKNWFSSLISPDTDEEQESEGNSEDSGNDVPGTLSGWILRAIDEKKPNKVSGEIVFGIKDGHWTLISFDENLIYNFYGFPKE